MIKAKREEITTPISPITQHTKNRIALSHIDGIKNTQLKNSPNQAKLSNKNSLTEEKNIFNSNIEKINSLENILIQKKFDITSTVKNLKKDIEKQINNILKSESIHDKNYATNETLNKQKDIIEYYTYSLKELNKNEILTRKSKKIKDDIIELKSAIKYESKIKGLNYLEKKHSFLKSSHDEILDTIDIEDKNEKLENLIKIQNSIKNLLKIELKNLKGKVYNITSDYQKENLVKELNIDKNRLMKEKEKLIEFNIRLQHDNKLLNFSKLQLIKEKEILARLVEHLEKEKQQPSNNKNNNTKLLKRRENMQKDERPHKKSITCNLSQRIDSKLQLKSSEKSHNIDKLIDDALKLIDSDHESQPTNAEKKYASNVSLNSTSDYYSENDSLVSDTSSRNVNKKVELVRSSKQRSTSNKKKINGPLARHKDNCLSAGISTLSTPEQLQARLSERNNKIKARNHNKK
ncbi:MULTISPECIES: hypothetical protein [Providencia]|uniref:hypothetical protein n=1 Tax=Providencia TaxID=586 RepID=UPI00197DBF80|nr:MULTISPECIES: hypothetical protein [Providencia]MBN4865861.1 hypothetical protein [Providencia stuartii]MBN4875183.1 hypothetical protein [Providencia stuartii]MBN4879874.1 hypothetical protein [Providencia stuartii]MBN4884605.1 hypothetical protein [Providencia stuartii]